MRFSGKDARAPVPGKMTRKEIASIVERIIASVAVEHGLIDSGDGISPDAKLHDDLGMDEIDVMEVLFRVEEHFGNNLPDEIEVSSSQVSDIVDLVAERVGEREATLVLAHSPDLVPEAEALELPPTAV